MYLAHMGYPANHLFDMTAVSPVDLDDLQNEYYNLLHKQDKRLPSLVLGTASENKKTDTKKPKCTICEEFIPGSPLKLEYGLPVHVSCSAVAGFSGRMTSPASHDESDGEISNPVFEPSSLPTSWMDEARGRPRDRRQSGARRSARSVPFRH